MNDEDRDDLAKQIMELKGEMKDAALRIRTGLDAQSTALSELTDQMKKLNLNVERLWRVLTQEVANACRLMPERVSVVL